MTIGDGESIWRRFVRRLTDAPAPAPQGATRNDLLKRAAKCYTNANQLDDATRLYHELGEVHEEAMCLERLGRFEAAGIAYRRIADWRSSARCFLFAGRPDDAGEDLVLAGDVLPGAWLLAHEAQHFVRASVLAEAYAPVGAVETLARELILARAEAGNQQTSRAALRLRNVAIALPASSADAMRNEVWNWAFELANVLRRPDLTASLYAAQVTARIPGAEQRWEEWTAGLVREPERKPHG